MNQAGWQQQLDANTQAFLSGFVQRARFLTAFPTSLTPAQFVDALFANAGVVPTPAARQAVINRFGGAGNTSDSAARVAAILDVLQNSSFVQVETNRAFVLMEYFGVPAAQSERCAGAGFELRWIQFLVEQTKQLWRELSGRGNGQGISRFG